MTKKVYHFIPSLNDGGAETLVIDYCTIANKNGVGMGVISFIETKSSVNENKAKNNNIDVVRIYKKWNIFSRLIHKFLGAAFVPFILKRIIKRERIEVIHAHLKVLKYLSPISKFLKRHNIKLFYTCHSEPKKVFVDSRKEFLSCKKLLKNNGLRIIALHRQMKNELNSLFGIGNTLIVKNGIDFNSFSPQQSIHAKKRQIGIPLNSFVVGHVGRFDAVKNHSFILDVFIRVLKRKEDSLLLLVGTGELEEDIKAKIIKYGLGNKVLILHHRNDIPDLLNIMDVFLFPSLYEGISISLLEAQRIGVNCVVSDSVNEETFCSNLIVRKSLKASPEEWADSVLNPISNFTPLNNIRDYDLNTIVFELINLYNE